MVVELSSIETKQRESKMVEVWCGKRERESRVSEREKKNGGVKNGGEEDRSRRERECMETREAKIGSSITKGKEKRR